VTGQRQVLPDLPSPRSLRGQLDVAAIRALCGDQTDVLGSPRQVARFLCGMASPGLTRHALFGAAQGRPFAEVLDCGARARRSKATVARAGDAGAVTPRAPSIGR
jgi:ATP-dependent DNA helicase RecQ